MAQTIRLCTWNIEFGFQLGAILDALQDCDDFKAIDLLALQEASARFGVKDARAVAHALGAQYEYYQVTAQHIEGRAQANALIWRRHLFDKPPEVISLSDVQNMRLTRAERTLLRAIPPQKRIAIRAESEALRVYVMHLDVIGFTHKLEQFRAILTDSAARAQVPLTIIAGDLNTFRLRSRPKWTTLEQDAKQAGFKDLTSDIRWTHSVARLRFRQKLDAIFVKGAHPTHYRSWSLPIEGSDHIPVFAEIKAD